MDIEYLLLLQRFRESINDALTPFMESISLFSVTYLIMIPVLVYWVVDKRKGWYTLLSYYLCCGVNAAVTAEILWEQLNEQMADNVTEEHYGYDWCRCSQTMIAVISTQPSTRG